MPNPCDDCGACSDATCCHCECDDSPEQTMRPTDKTNLPPTRRACGNCGRLGHLARTCTAPKKAHDKIGVEVEGWWRTDRWSDVEAIADNWHMSGTEDGSLDHDRSGETKPYEFRTRPGSLGEQISQVIAIYPDKCDKSAGMHVHMSFNDPHDATCLATTEFLAYFRQRWEAWGARMQVHSSSDFWSRLRGDNDDYCAINSAESIRRPTQMGRYHQLNFSSWGRHGTLECRMLPLFRDARLAVSALEEWVAIVEDFIRDNAAPLWARYDREVAIDTAPRATYERTVDLESIPSSEEYASPVRTGEVLLDRYYPDPRRSYNLPTVRNVAGTVSVPTERSREVSAEIVYTEPTPVPAGYHRVFSREAAQRLVLASLRQGGF